MTRVERENVTVSVIVQTVNGDLRLRGRTGTRLVVDGDGVNVEQLGDEQPYIVRAAGDCRVTVPDDVNVSVQTVNGDATLSELRGRLDVQSVRGDLTVRNVGEVRIKSAAADLRIKHAVGDVSVESVGADATIREVDGAVWAASVGADLYVRNIGGNCVVESVGSDLVLSIDFMPDRTYRFGAGSDVLCRVHPDADATFYLPAEMEVRLDIDAEVTDTEDGQMVRMGDGSATIYIDRGQELQLVGEEEDYMISFGVQIEEELEARLSSLEEKLSQQLEGLDERIQAKTEQFASQAERFAERAQRQAERAADRLRRNMERRKRKREPGLRGVAFRADVRPGKKHEPVSEEERLMILQMVQENKISIEEAERLLSALES